MLVKLKSGDRVTLNLIRKKIQFVFIIVETYFSYVSLLQLEAMIMGLVSINLILRVFSSVCVFAEFKKINSLFLLEVILICLFVFFHSPSFSL